MKTQITRTTKMTDNKYAVEEYCLGRASENRIIFKTLSDMEKAYRDVDNGNDICIVKDGVVVKLLNKLINTKLFDGTLLFCAKEETK